MHKGKLNQLQPAKQKLEPKKSWGSGRGGRAWRRLREQIILRDSQVCGACGRVALKPEVDHITPKFAGGSDDPVNLQVLCRTPCHSDKTAKEASGRGS